jgi:hypothetical protein
MAVTVKITPPLVVRINEVVPTGTLSVVRGLVLLSTADELAEVATALVALVIGVVELALIGVDEADVTGTLDEVVTEVDEDAVELVGSTVELVVVGDADEVKDVFDDADGVGEAVDDADGDADGVTLRLDDGAALAVALALALREEVGVAVPVSLLNRKVSDVRGNE